MNRAWLERVAEFNEGLQRKEIIETRGTKIIFVIVIAVCMLIAWTQ